MTTALLDRILRESQGANLLELLVQQLTPTDLQSLLLEVYRQRAARQMPADVLANYERNRFVRPSPTSPHALIDVDRLALSLATPLFEPIELAPVCPLGTNSVMASVDQNNTIATIRNTELVSDSTNVLALECAARRRIHLRAPDQVRKRVRVQVIACCGRSASTGPLRSRTSVSSRCVQQGAMRGRTDSSSTRSWSTWHSICACCRH